MKPQIKYALAIALVAVMLLAALSGCTSDTPTGTTNPSSPTWLPGDTTGSGTESTPGSTETIGGTEPTGTTAPADTTAPTTESTTPTECQHSYGDWAVQRSAACTADGSRVRTCSKCNDKQTETIKATGHSYGSWTTTRAAACDTDGTKTRTCASCSNKETQTIAATGHAWDEGTVTSAPTSCSETGAKVYTCNTCGSTKTEQVQGNHAFGAWEYEEYTYVYTYENIHGSMEEGTKKSHRKVRVCTKCGYKENDDTPDHYCAKGSVNHTVSTIQAGTCSTPAKMRSTCKICGWYVDYDGATGDHNWTRRTEHLTDYGPYTNELDAEISECSACGSKSIIYIKGEGWNDYNRYYVDCSISYPTADGGSPIPDDFTLYENPKYQAVKRDFVYDSAGYVKQYTAYWWYNGSLCSQVINCGQGEIEAWFADCGLTGDNIKHYTLKCYGSYLAPHKVSWSS